MYYKMQVGGIILYNVGDINVMYLLLNRGMVPLLFQPHFMLSTIHDLHFSLGIRGVYRNPSIAYYRWKRDDFLLWKLHDHF